MDNVMPMFHMGGCGFSTLGTLHLRGTHVIVIGFDPSLFLELVETEKGKFALLVPTMLDAILNFPERKKYNISTLKNILSGASKVEVSLVRRVKKELDCSISIVFGQTEMHGGITQTYLDDTIEDQAKTIGQPYPQIEVKIADPVTGQVLPLGVEGEICCRGYQTMIGYYNMPEETAAVFKSDGWLHSGDLGSMDERGFLKITGRLKDIIIRGGENIYPAEIENLLKKHPKIANAVVVGVPDEYWGEQVGEIIIPKSPENRPTHEDYTTIAARI
ncbi:AMP-binding protein [Desulfallas sp. Bu1-1]|uniref:class I adenylate-forming enzyme family protein n=1 Tax=Desulfallas sp. Bu1-1 TaxID=2787620 RepID=UPI00189DFCC5|nr:AMP-binding protein [Desulfallas sp. Bu1-1]MBF7082843.1 AMP-binding protein [Desulfallas sp. Bu1-1]